MIHVYHYNICYFIITIILNWKMNLFFLIVSLFFLVLGTCFLLPGPIVKTRWGLIKGIYQTFDKTQIKSFLGIPYALPPVGPLRFHLPIPVTGHYHGVYDASQFGPACAQTEINAAIHTPNTSVSESCLYLNVWTPLNATSSTSYPVLAYIHGSSFTFGSAAGQRSRGDILTAHGNVIVVNMNHRLGAIGFAYGISDDIIGNQAVHDVILALQWIHDNIAEFGGDPNQVTLSGMSSGAIIASMIFITPSLQSQLFNKLVLMSGVALDPITVIESKTSFKQTKSLSRSLGCSSFQKSPRKFSFWETNCLKKVSSDRIVNAPENPIFGPMYGDRYIFPESPRQILNTLGVAKNYSILIGTEADEDLLARNFNPKTINEAKNQLNSIFSGFELSSESNFTQLIDEYFIGINDTDVNSIRRRFHGFISDAMFQCPSLLFANNFAKNNGNRVYLYRNDYVSSYFSSETRPYGAFHADDHRLFLGEPFRSPEMYPDDADRKASQFMMTVLSDFIKGRQLFWPSIKSNNSSEPLFPRWRIANNASLDLIDSDEDKDLCFKWAQFFKINI